MENRRLVRSIWVILFVLLILVLPPSPVKAWDNLEAHPEMNRLALALFMERVRAGDVPGLSAISLNGDPCWGISLNRSDGIEWLFKQRAGVERQESLKQWIEDGGFSADEPETAMALRHFYSPRSEYARPWLTDFRPVPSWAAAPYNPQISAVEWANGEKNNNLQIVQKYSWPMAKEYLIRALADKFPSNKSYGMAWRAVGETMHLVEDMTVPAHVRNDCHIAGLDPDPLEAATESKETVAQYFSHGWSTKIDNDYNLTPTELMKALAGWTSENFLSKDTIPIPFVGLVVGAEIPGLTRWRQVTANNQLKFESPTPEEQELNPDGYVYYTVDGKRIRMARRSAFDEFGLNVSKTPPWIHTPLGYSVDDKLLLQDQQKLLIPTAVRGAEAVLERFFPRFMVKVKVIPCGNAIQQWYKVQGRIMYLPEYNNTPSEWPDDLIVNNGAYIVVNNGQPIMVPQGSVEENGFTYEPLRVPDGTMVQARYDLGGYVIESKPVPCVAPGPNPSLEPCPPNP